MSLSWIRLQSKQGVNTQEGYSLVFFHTKTATSENVGIQFRPSRAISNFPTLKTPKLCRKKKDGPPDGTVECFRGHWQVAHVSTVFVPAIHFFFATTNSLTFYFKQTQLKTIKWHVNNLPLFCIVVAVPPLLKGKRSNRCFPVCNHCLELFQKREWSSETRVEIRNFRHCQLPNRQTHTLEKKSKTCLQHTTHSCVLKNVWASLDYVTVHAIWRWNFTLVCASTSKTNISYIF